MCTSFTAAARSGRSSGRRCWLRDELGAVAEWRCELLRCAARRCAALRAASCAALLRRAARGCWPRVAREGWVTPRRLNAFDAFPWGAGHGTLRWTHASEQAGKALRSQGHQCVVM